MTSAGWIIDRRRRHLHRAGWFTDQTFNQNGDAWFLISNRPVSIGAVFI